MENTRRIFVKCLLILSVKMIYIFTDFDTMAELIKLAKMAGVMHEANHAYSNGIIWWLRRLATNVPFLACVLLVGYVEFCLRVWIVIF